MHSTLSIATFISLVVYAHIYVIVTAPSFLCAGTTGTLFLPIGAFISLLHTLRAQLHRFGCACAGFPPFRDVFLTTHLNTAPRFLCSFAGFSAVFLSKKTLFLPIGALVLLPMFKITTPIGIQVSDTVT